VILPLPALPALVALCLAALPAAGQGPLREPIAPKLGGWLADAGLAGAVVARIDGDRIELGAAGWAHAPSRAPMRADARVHVGSVAKPVLALAVLRLVSTGRLTLDAPVAALLPGVPLDNPWPSSHPLLLRHLLDHTSGLDDLHLWHLLNRQHAPDMPLRDAYARHPDLLRPRVAPGTRMSYSNFGYLLAGMVVEAVTGERYEAWAGRELLLPLGMADSRFDFTTQQGPQADPRLAWGHLDDLQPLAAMTTAVRPGAQFTTTAADMARLMQFTMGDGRVGGQAFIDPSLLRAMGRPQGTDAARAGLAAGYALGLATRDRHGVVGLCHEGSIVGFRAMMCLYPQARRAFFVGINTDREDGGHLALYEGLTRSLDLPAVPAPRAQPTPEASAGAWNGRYVRAPSRMQQFAAADVLLDTRLWQADADGVRWSRGGQSDALERLAPGLYRLPGRVQASLVLLRDAGGAPMVSDGFGSFRRLPAGLWQAAWASMGLGAAGLAWWLVVPPWRRLRRGAPLLRPGWLAALALPGAAAAVALQGWQALGELTPASALLWLASAALPAAMAWHLALAWHRRAWGDGAASLAVLQAVALVAAGGLLPLALWQ
jgi:CubicO group peptidase (beta-lactamase class C family)